MDTTIRTIREKCHTNEDTCHFAVIFPHGSDGWYKKVGCR